MEERTQHKTVPRLLWHRDSILGGKQEGPCLLSEAGWGPGISQLPAAGLRGGAWKGQEQSEKSPEAA